MTALYELSQQYHELAKLAESDDIPMEVIRDTLEGILGTAEEKAIAVAKFVLSLQADAAAIAAVAKAQTERAQRVKTRGEALKHYLLYHMQLMQIKVIDRPDIVIKRQASPAALQVTDALKIPAEYWVQPDPPPKRIDAGKLKAAIMNGAQVDGAWVESGEHVRVSP